MSDESFDVAVIGSGPGGEGAAMQAAKEGLHCLDRESTGFIMTHQLTPLLHLMPLMLG